MLDQRIEKEKSIMIRNKSNCVGRRGMEILHIYVCVYIYLYRNFVHSIVILIPYAVVSLQQQQNLNMIICYYYVLF